MQQKAMPDESMSSEAMPGEPTPHQSMSQEVVSREAMSDSDTRTDGGIASGTGIGAGAPVASGTHSDSHSDSDCGSGAADPVCQVRPVRESDRALFRAHAAARLRGDTPEALRLALQIGEEKRMAHLLYVLYLFTRTVYAELGDTPDPWDLAELTRRLHERHFRPGGGFWAIRAEAMVRGVCGDSVLLTEVPVAEQPTYMWTVVNELVGAEVTDAQIGDALDEAEAIGAELARAGWNSMFADVPAPHPAAEPEPSATPEQEPDPAPTAAETAPSDSEDERTGPGDPTGDPIGDRTDIEADEETTA